MTALDIFADHGAPRLSRWRDDIARLAIVALVFANAWLALAHLDPPRPAGTSEDWHGNVMASTPR